MYVTIIHQNKNYEKIPPFALLLKYILCDESAGFTLVLPVPVVVWNQWWGTPVTLCNRPL